MCTLYCLKPDAKAQTSFEKSKSYRCIYICKYIYVIKWSPKPGRKKNCYREEPSLTPCWNCFFDLFFVAVAVIIIYSGLPQRTLPLCETLYSVHRKIIWPCPLANDCQKKKRTGSEREKALATHSSVLAWRILSTEEPGELLFIGSHRVGHDWSDLACECTGEGNGNPLQYSCLENPRDRGTWQATVHGVTQTQTQLSD